MPKFIMTPRKGRRLKLWIEKEYISMWALWYLLKVGYDKDIFKMMHWEERLFYYDLKDNPHRIPPSLRGHYKNLETGRWEQDPTERREFYKEII